MDDLGFKLKVFRQIGLLRLQLPHRLIGAGLQLAKWGPGIPSAVGAAAARYPNQKAIIDDAGEMTWSEVRDEINRLTQGLKDRGLEAGDSVALLCRNHRHVVIAAGAIIQAGGRILMLNTMASSSQLGELTVREDAKMVILDQEFLDIAEKVDRDKLILAWTDEERPSKAGGSPTDGIPSLAGIAQGQPTKDHPKPPNPGSIVIFTSGTTGLPKGANRKEPDDLKPLLTFFGSIPYRGNKTVIIAAPLFHSWGLINLGFGLSTVPTYVLRRRFDAVQVIKDIEKYQADVLVVVPQMIQRLVDVAPEIREATDTSSLRITASSGSALAGGLANRFMDLYTDSLYNFYGATETGWVTIASPQQLREAPGTAGTPPYRTTVLILDHNGNEVPQGETGVIHVGNDMPFGGYTDGNTKSFSNGLMSTGDLGYFDEKGHLFVSGRDDDMVISGGENVFPSELEDALIDHPHVFDVVVTGIPDEDWGQCLVAYIVVREGASLTEPEIIAYARERVARFAVPRRMMFVEELPRNPTGKIMKHHLPDFE
ncbi:MAG: AMP-binding protein [Aeromicrobium sp.]